MRKITHSTRVAVTKCLDSQLPAFCVQLRDHWIACGGEDLDSMIDWSVDMKQTIAEIRSILDLTEEIVQHDLWNVIGTNWPTRSRGSSPV